MIVVVVALVNGLISGIITGSLFGTLISTVLSTLIGWVAWSAITYFVGTNFFEGQADLGEMLRVMGFAFVPQILGFIPCVNFLTFLYTLVLGFIAVRQGLDLDNTKAALTVAIGFIVYMIIFFVLAAVLGITAVGVGLLTGS